MSTDPYKRKCEYSPCGKTFDAKRTNEKYCCRDHKTKANNGLARALREKIKNVDYQLKMNRKILEQFFVMNKIDVSMDLLTRNGFDHRYHTARGYDSKGIFTGPQYYNYELVIKSDNYFKITKLW